MDVLDEYKRSTVCRIRHHTHIQGENVAVIVVTHIKGNLQRVNGVLIGIDARQDGDMVIKIGVAVGIGAGVEAQGVRARSRIRTVGIDERVVGE